MSSNFDCFVQINGNKYDISINNFEFCTVFENIYPKMKQIVGIAENIDIDLESHDFVIFENQSMTGLRLERMTQIVKHKSMIYITPKPSLCISPSAVNQTTSDSTVTRVTQEVMSHSNVVSNLSEDQQILDNENDIRDYRSVLMEINIGWNFRQMPRNWNKLFRCLDPNKKWTFSEHNMRQFFCKWSSFYAENYHRIDGKVGSKSQQIFDYLKTVHTIDLNKIYDSSHQTIRQIRQIGGTPQMMNYYQKYLYQIRDQKVADREVIKANKNSKIERLIRINETEEKYIEEHENDIKEFHSIVMAINIGWNNKTEHLWRKAYKNIKIDNKRQLSDRNIADIFHKWTKYYVLNFNEIDGKLSQKSQTIFDLLKVVHVLDLERIYWPTNRLVLKIKSIEKRPDFIDYYRKHLKQIREEKEKTKEVVKQHKS